MTFWAKAALYWFFLEVCRAHELSCNTKWDGHQMIYKASLVNENMTLEGYSWANPTVLATETNPAGWEHVKMSTADTLITLKCYDNVVLTKHYISKDNLVLEYIANCSTSCEAVMSRPVQDEPSHAGITVGGGVCIGVGVVLVAVIVLVIKFKDKICRKFCCSQTGGLYNPVKMQNLSPKPLDVQIV